MNGIWTTVFPHLARMGEHVWICSVTMSASALWGILEETVSRRLMNAKAIPASTMVHVKI